MESTSVSLDLGIILCKHCQKVIGTLDTEKVTTYYSDCQEQQCLEKRAKKTNKGD